jgi:hypothetical protein
VLALLLGQDIWLIWGERKGAYRALMGKPEGRRPLGRSRHIILKWIFERLDGGHRLD